MKTYGLNYYTIFIVDREVWHLASLAGCMKKVEKATGINNEEIKGRSRKVKVVFARHLFCALAKKRTKESFSTIGNFIGKDHATVMNSIKKVEDIPDLRMIFERILNGEI